jgi:CRP-like cAMP-binding protein
VFLDVPRTASLIAKEQVQALRIPAKRFLKLVTHNPEIALEVMRQLSKKIIFTSEMAVESKNKLRDLQGARNAS